MYKKSWPFLFRQMLYKDEPDFSDTHYRQLRFTDKSHSQFFNVNLFGSRPFYIWKIKKKLKIGITLKIFLVFRGCVLRKAERDRYLILTSYLLPMQLSPPPPPRAIFHAQQQSLRAHHMFTIVSSSHYWNHNHSRWNACKYVRMWTLGLLPAFKNVHKVKFEILFSAAPIDCPKSTCNKFKS